VGALIGLDGGERHNRISILKNLTSDDQAMAMAGVMASGDRAMVMAGGNGER
jgi:hypothetical protein